MKCNLREFCQNNLSKIKYDLGSMVEFENYVLTAFTNFDADEIDFYHIQHNLNFR